MSRYDRVASVFLPSFSRHHCQCPDYDSGEDMRGPAASPLTDYELGTLTTNEQQSAIQ